MEELMEELLFALIGQNEVSKKIGKIVVEEGYSLKFEKSEGNKAVKAIVYKYDEEGNKTQLVYYIDDQLLIDGR